MKKILFLSKIFALLNGVSILLLFGGFSGFAGKGILENENIWSYYNLILISLFILGIGGIILGLTLKINESELTEDINIHKGRGFNSISNMLLITSPFLLLIAIVFIWFSKFSSF